MSTYTSCSGKKYTLGKVLDEGAEGKVCQIIGNSDIAARIYRDNRFRSSEARSAAERKLKTMINMNIPVRIDGIVRLEWPIDILYQNDSIAGFVMPLIRANCHVYDVERADPCRKNGHNSRNPFERAFPDYTWKYNVQIAYNLAWIVNYMHSKDIVIGDFNPINFLVDTATGAVVLGGCDSFDIRNPDSGEHFPCVLGFPDLLAPELQTVGGLSKGMFTKETDNFSLAILIFRLLMRNADPFGGTVTHQQEPGCMPEYRQAILSGNCVYVKHVPGRAIPRWAPTLDMLPSEIQNLFRKTFDYDAFTAGKRIRERAAAHEWCRALLPLAAPEPNKNLRQCSVSKRHIYPAGSSCCPWCRCLQSEGPIAVR